ncbi:MAG TPA: MBL fold metallo-hydrolase [Bauldia sp.]|nr:MBL fold metallo-hydrolase [Bauldia sp.]
MTRFICRQCGTQYADTEAPPPSCLICTDDRQYVRWTGQDWLTLADLQKSHTHKFTSEGEGVTGIAMEPNFAINQRPLLLESKAGNVLWECHTLLTDATIAEVNRRGGLSAIAISHPHYYSTMLEWSDAFGGVPIYIHANDRHWVMRRGPQIVHWTGATLRMNGEMTLVLCGGHFPGGQVLHWDAGEGGKGALFTGDIMMVAQTRRHVTFMHSFPNYMPLNASAVRGIASAVEPYAYDAVYGAWTGLNIKGGGKQAVAVSVERYIHAIAG